MRIIAAAIALLFMACTHGGDGKPGYCSRKFNPDSLEWDLDDDGIVAGTDFAIYMKNCTE